MADIATCTSQIRPHWRKLGCAILLAGSLTACASGPDRRPPRGGGERPAADGYQGQVVKPVALLVSAMDRDGDRVVDGDELAVGIGQEWQRFSDAGAMRALNFEDWAHITLGSRDALPSFAAFDRNLDGTISKEEFGERLRGEFTDLDKNADGRLERSELVFRVTRPQRGQQGGQGSRGREEGRRPPRR